MDDQSYGMTIGMKHLGQYFHMVYLFFGIFTNLKFTNLEFLGILDFGLL